MKTTWFHSSRFLAWASLTLLTQFSRAQDGTPGGIGTPNPRPVVSMELIDPHAAETRIDQSAIFWAEFRVRRTGDLATELVAYLNTQQGSARFGQDYRLDHVDNGSTVRFAAGQASVNVRLYPIDDEIYEGEESVFFHLIAPPPGAPNPCDIDLAHSSVTMVIGDNDPVTTRLEITAPRHEQHFEAGETIELRSQIVGPGSGDSWVVEFLDGDQRIGTTPPGGAIWWSDAIGGPHTINARAVTLNPDPAGSKTLIAEPVTISVGPGPAWPVVSIGVLGRGKTLEPCPVCFSPTAAFVISRTGPATGALTVYIEYDGPATQEQDYRDMPHHVTIPSGQKSVNLILPALDDLLVEGPEIVRATIVSPEIATLGYVVSNSSARAMLVIDDDEAGSPDIRLDIVEPQNGAEFAAGSPITLSALGVWREGEVDRPVKFFAGNTFIGQSNPPLLGRPTIPCLPSVHTIVWTNPPPGDHLLTARFEKSPDVIVSSPPVSIAVKDDHPETNQVRISVEDDIAKEISVLTVVDVVRFRVSRNGDLTRELTVFYSAHGSATPGTDYRELSGSIRIPAGAASADLTVSPIYDRITEGMETLLIRLEPSPFAGPLPTYEIAPAADDSVAVIVDGPDLPGSTIEIVWPEDGARFPLPGRIEIIAAAYHPVRDVLGVDFYAGKTKIGESAFVFDHTVSGGLIVHRFTWNKPSPGTHALTALGYDEEHILVATSPPVHITVGPVVDGVVLDVIATDPLASETGEDGASDPAMFTVRRISGPQDIAVPVYYTMGGTAQNGVDYAELNGSVLLPAGAESVGVVVRPIPDSASEGDETVVFRLEPPVCIAIFPPPPECYQIGANGTAQAVIHEGRPNLPPEGAITSPASGAEFSPDTPIEIVVACRDPDGYVRKVEFFANGRKIGETSIDFIREPDPGEPQTFTFVWRHPEPGTHTIVARLTDDRGAATTSVPVEIKVGMSEPLPIVIVAAPDPIAVEPRPDGTLNTASFRIRGSVPRRAICGSRIRCAARRRMESITRCSRAWPPFRPGSVRQGSSLVQWRTP